CRRPTRQRSSSGSRKSQTRVSRSQTFPQPSQAVARPIKTESVTCTRPSDITTCPDKNTWGLSYDDGPSPDTPRLLDYLASQNLHSTFFVVGSRALSRQDILQAEYMQGHQLSVH
ncbi:1336_t:CDS:2, partial [Acaulospora colombiana]